MQTVRQHIQQIRNAVGVRPRIVGWRLRQRHLLRRPEWLDESDVRAALYRDGEQLLRQGEVRWAHIVQADSRLMEKGIGDLPAAIVYCDGVSLDGRIESLAGVASRLVDLTRRRFDNPEVDRLAAALTRERQPVLHQSVPRALARDLPAMRCTSIIVQRQLLPTRMLSFSWFPIFVAPSMTQATQIVSYRYWPRLLVKLWRANFQ